MTERANNKHEEFFCLFLICNKTQHNDSSQSTNKKEKEDSNNKQHLLRLALFREVQVEVDQVGLISCAETNGSDNGSGGVGKGLVVNSTTVHRTSLFPFIKCEG